MGQSTDALLLFGIALAEGSMDEYDEPGSDGSKPPRSPALLSYMSFMGNTEDGVELVQHCSDSCPMFFLAIELSVTRAWRGHPKQIARLTADPEWTDRLRKFAKECGAQTEGEPGWFLASWWG